MAGAWAALEGQRGRGAGLCFLAISGVAASAASLAFPVVRSRIVIAVLWKVTEPYFRFASCLAARLPFLVLLVAKAFFKKLSYHIGHFEAHEGTLALDALVQR